MGRRLLRVNEAIREAVSAIIATDLKDQRLGFVTVTGVETTPDLRHATVFVSVLGSGVEHEASLHALRSSHGFIQGLLAERVRLKRTPQLTFVYDDTTDKAMRISGIIDRYLREHPEPPLAEGDQSEDQGGAGALDEGGGEDDGDAPPLPEEGPQ